MKPYAKPVIQKVDLNPEQAVLGTCSVGEIDLRDLSPIGCELGGRGACKQRKADRGETTSGDSGATS